MKNFNSWNKVKYKVWEADFPRFSLNSDQIFVITVRDNYLEETFLVTTTDRTFLFDLAPILPWKNNSSRRSRLINGSDFPFYEDYRIFSKIFCSAVNYSELFFTDLNIINKYETHLNKYRISSF